MTEYQLFCRKRVSAKIKKKLKKFLKIMRAPKGPNVRIACCAFKNQRVSAVILETRNSTSGAIWFSTYRLLRNLLSLIRTNDDRSTRQVTSQPYSIHSISPTFRTCFKRPLQNKTVTWRWEHNSSNSFFYLTKRKKISMLRTTETTILFFDS